MVPTHVPTPVDSFRKMGADVAASHRNFGSRKQRSSARLGLWLGGQERYPENGTVMCEWMGGRLGEWEAGRAELTSKSVFVAAVMQSASSQIIDLHSSMGDPGPECF